MKTKELDFIKRIFMSLSRKDKVSLLSASCLNDIEINLLTQRFIQGVSLKECAAYYGIEVNSVCKKQSKAIKKLYQYLINT
jgi:DNA-directed RNA polymerase specialized sigma subunit